MMKENKLRQMLSSGQPTLGTRVVSTWPVFTEMVGDTGHFDYIEFVAEYTPFDQYDLENIARAAELHNMGSMIKVDFENRIYVAQKAVGAGFQAILFADHKTPEEIRETVRLMKSDMPHSGGRFGFPNRRFIGHQPYLPQLEHAQRVDDIVLCFMIEKREALDNIDEICLIPGVDMVQFGPSDFAMSNGWNKADHAQECKDAEKRMIEAALKHGIQPRVEIYGDAAQVDAALAMGVKHICFEDQIKIYGDFLRSGGSRMRELMKGAR